jgi:hypothetical protein
MHFLMSYVSDLNLIASGIITLLYSFPYIFKDITVASLVHSLSLQGNENICLCYM